MDAQADKPRSRFGTYRNSPMRNAALALLLVGCAPTPHPPASPTDGDTLRRLLRDPAKVETIREEAGTTTALDDAERKEIHKTYRATVHVVPRFDPPPAPMAVALSVPPEDRLIWDADRDGELTDADTTAMRWAILRHDGNDAVRGVHYVEMTAAHFGLPAPWGERAPKTLVLEETGQTVPLPAATVPVEDENTLLRYEQIGDVLLISLTPWDQHWGEGEAPPDSTVRVVPPPEEEP